MKKHDGKTLGCNSLKSIYNGIDKSFTYSGCTTRVGVPIAEILWDIEEHGFDTKDATPELVCDMLNMIPVSVCARGFGSLELASCHLSLEILLWQAYSTGMACYPKFCCMKRQHAFSFPHFKFKLRRGVEKHVRNTGLHVHILASFPTFVLVYNCRRLLSSISLLKSYLVELFSVSHERGK